MNGLGLSDATRRVADHARSLVQLEVQLAIAEMRRKAIELGTGVGLMLAAAMFAFFAFAFLLGAAAAAIALEVAVWEAMLIMFGALVLVTTLLVAIGLVYLRRGAKPLPEQALDEAKLTAEALRDEVGAVRDEPGA